MRAFKLSVVLLALLSLVSATNVDDLSFPEFTINLDLPPEQRFVEVTKHFRTEIIDQYHLFMTEVPMFAQDLFVFTSWIWFFTHNERYWEIYGIVKAIDQHEITQAKGILMNFLYELESWCTSIVAKQQDGQIIHSRNLDFDFSDNMRKMTYRATFTKGGKYSYEAVMFGATIGTYTGFKKGAYSISENQRFPEKSKYGLVENLVMGFAGFQEISWMIRDTLEQCEDYDCAYKNLKNKKINALGYLTIAGTKDDEGVVISRARFGTVHEDKLDTKNGKWYVVQTNNDHWVKDGCWGRCAAAKKNLDRVGHAAITIDNLRTSVLTLYPNLNNDTIYNTQFIPKTSFLDTIAVKYPVSETDSYVAADTLGAPETYEGRKFNRKTDLVLTEPKSYMAVAHDIFMGALY